MPATTYVGQSTTVVPNTVGFWTVYHNETGQALTVWPVDAKELIEQGAYSLTPPVLPEGTIVPPPKIPAAVREAAANNVAVAAIQSDAPAPKRK